METIRWLKLQKFYPQKIACDKKRALYIETNLLFALLEAFILEHLVVYLCNRQVSIYILSVNLNARLQRIIQEQGAWGRRPPARRSGRQKLNNKRHVYEWCIHKEIWCICNHAAELSAAILHLTDEQLSELQDLQPDNLSHNINYFTFQEVQHASVKTAL